MGYHEIFMKVSDSSVSCVMLELGTYVSIQSIFDMFNEKTFIFMKKHNVINKFRRRRFRWQWQGMYYTFTVPLNIIIMMMIYVRTIIIVFEGESWRKFIFVSPPQHQFLPWLSFHGFVLE